MHHRSHDSTLCITCSEQCALSQDSKAGFVMQIRRQPNYTPGSISLCEAHVETTY